jgi:glycosyltransferase involved in cell wall biosynthesis
MRVLIALKMNANKIGAIEHYIAMLARALRARGDELIVSPLSASELVAASWRAHGAKVIPWGDGGLIGLMNVVRAHEPDISILQFFPMVSSVSWCVRLAGSRAVMVVDDHSGWPTYRGLSREVARVIAHRASLAPARRVLAVSEFVRRRHIERVRLPASRSRVVYNGVRAPDMALDKDEVPTLVMIGNMIQDKGFDLLIDACATLADQNLRVLLVGDGVERASLEAHAREVAPHVEFLGRRDDVPEILSRAHIAVVPSRWQEAFGCVTAEAMRAKCCVIVSDVGASRELVTHRRTGLVVPPDDAMALADAIRFALENPEKRARFAEAAKQDADHRFAVERMVQDILQTLIEVDHETRQRDDRAHQRLARDPRA